MGLMSGTVTVRRLFVSSSGGKALKLDEGLLEKLRENVLPEDRPGIAGEVEYGWSGGRHLFDSNISFEHSVFGDWLVLGMRVDSHKAPADLVRAYRAIEEESLAAENPSGFLSKSQKREAKEAAEAKIEEEIREGRHRRSKLVSLAWDTARGVIYTPAGGKSMERLLELFERTFGAELEPYSAGRAAGRMMDSAGRHRDYEDLVPTRFVASPGSAGGEDEHVTAYPWVAKGPEPKEFLGNEFAMWLWHAAETDGGTVELADKTDAAVLIDRMVDLDCAYAVTGKANLRGDGPTKMPEARDAARSGKVLRKLGLVLEHVGRQYSLTLAAEGLTLGAMRLPDPPAEKGGKQPDPRVAVEHRLEQIRDACGVMDELLAVFLKLRCSSDWNGFVSAWRSWMGAGTSRAKVEVEVFDRPAKRAAVGG
jgi:hypothetical protein